MAEKTEGGTVLAEETRRLRELLTRWMELERTVLPPDELARLREDTRRALGSGEIPVNTQTPPPTS